MRTPIPRPGLALAALLLAAAAALAPVGCAPQKAGFAMDTDAPDVAIRGPHGTSVDFAHPDGRVSVVTFGYTSCPDVCPTTLADWKRLRKRLGAGADHVRFVFVSVDYRNDTPEVADAFAKNFDPSFTGALLDSALYGEVLQPFKAAASYESTPDSSMTAVSHTDYTYLVDERGRIATAYQFATKPDAIARDVRVLLAAGRERASRGS